MAAVSTRLMGPAAASISCETTENINKESLEARLNEIFDHQIQVREAQVDWIKVLTEERKDLIGIAKTGFGKSLIFQSVPLLRSDRQNACALIIYPLDALERDQAKNMERLIPTARPVVLNGDTLRSDPQILKAIKEGQYTHILTSPEIATSDRFYTEVLVNRVFRESLVLVAIDEAHCIDLWEGWREHYGRLETLRARTEESTPWFIISATLTPDMVTKVVKKLKFGEEKTNYILKRTDTDRPEIYIGIVPLQYSISSCLDLQFILPRPLVKVPYDEFNDENTSRKRRGLRPLLESPYPKEMTTAMMAAIIPKTMIYCDKISQCLHIQRCLRRMYHGDPCHIEVFYGSMAAREKKRLETEFKLKNSSIRILICTDAMGMGTDNEDIKMVIQWRKPSDGVVSLQQRGGRAARKTGEIAKFIWFIDPWMVDAPYCPEQIMLSVSERMASKKSSDSKQMSQLSQVFLVESDSEIGSDGIDTSKRATGKKSRQATFEEERRSKLEADIKYILYTADDTGEAKCLRKSINEIFGNNATEPRRNGECCSRCHPAVLQDVVLKAVEPARQRLTVKQSKDKKLHCIQKLKNWRTKAACAVFTATERSEEEMEKLGKAILDDDTLKKWASQSSWLEDRAKTDGEHAMTAIFGDWPWADKDTEEGRRWIKELYTILKDTR